MIWQLPKRTDQQKSGKMRLPESLDIKEQFSKRVFNARYKNLEVVLKLFTPDDLDGCAAQIKHVFEDHQGTDCDYLETPLSDRVLYNIGVHYQIQKRLGVALTSEYYCEKRQSWVFDEVVVKSQSGGSDSSLPEERASRGSGGARASLVQLIHVFGVKFERDAQTFVSMDGQPIGLIFPRLGQTLMSFVPSHSRWVPNPMYASLVFGDELAVSRVFRAVAGSVSFLFKELNIVHKDIKIENICTERPCDSESGEVVPVLIDFGESQILSSNGKLRDAYGTHTMLPPEAFTCSLHSYNDENYLGYSAEKREVWSLGCLLYTLIFGSPPYFDTFSGKSPIEFQLSLCDESRRVDIPKYSNILNADVSRDLRDLLGLMLAKAPDERLALEGVLLHPWVMGQSPGEYILH